MAERLFPAEHDALIWIASTRLAERGFHDVRAHLRACPLPDAVDNPATGRRHIPDVTANGRRLLLFEAETFDSLDDPHICEQWPVFAAHAARQGGVFTLVVPKHAVSRARQRLAAMGVRARLWGV